MDTLVGDRSRPVGLGSAKLEAASLATQLESHHSVVPEKRQSTRVSLSTSPDSWQLLLVAPVHCWVLEVALNMEAALATPLSTNDPFTSAHIVCTLGQVHPGQSCHCLWSDGKTKEE